MRCSLGLTEGSHVATSRPPLEGGNDARGCFSFLSHSLTHLLEYMYPATHSNCPSRRLRLGVETLFFLAAELMDAVLPITGSGWGDQISMDMGLT